MTSTRSPRRPRRAAAVPVAALTALTVLTALAATACSSGSDTKAPVAAPSAPSAPATPTTPTTPTTPDATATTTPAKPGVPTLPGVPGASGGGGSLTLSGSGGGTYEFDKVGCVGEARPGGLLTVTGTPRSANVLVASVIFKDGQAELLLTVKGSTRPQQWKGKASVGEHASRTGDSAKLTDFPVKEELGATGTVSGTLTCSGTVGLH